MNGWQSCLMGNKWSVGFVDSRGRWCQVYEASCLEHAKRACILLLMYGGFPWEKSVEEWKAFVETLWIWGN